MEAEGRAAGAAVRAARAALAAAMLLGCVVLWVGVPLAWLWVGSQLQAHVSAGTAMVAALAGAIATIIVVVAGLARLNRRHAALGERGGQGPPPQSLLEVMLVASAAVAMVGFAIWFFGFSGTSPIPIQPGP